MYQPKSLHEIRIYHSRIIMSVLRQNGPMTKNDLALKTGLSLSSVTNILKILTERNLVTLGDKIDSFAGRPATYIVPVLDVVYFAYSLRGSLFVILLFGIYSRKYRPRETPVIVSMIVTLLVALFWVIYKAFAGTYPVSAGFSDTYAAVGTALLFMVIHKIALILRHKELSKE